MVINNNPMNPVPLWPSMNDWQCKQPTYHGDMAWPVAIKGELLPMQLTIGRDNCPSQQKSVTATYGGVTRNITVTMTNPGSLVINFPSDDPDERDVPITVSNQAKDKYNVYVNNTKMWKVAGIRNADIVTSEELDEGVNMTDGNGDNPLYLKVDIMSVTTLGLKVYKYNGAQVYTTTLTPYLLPIPKEVRTSDRFANINFNTIPIPGTYDDGVYYFTLTDVDNVVWYSEPFLWLSNVSRYLLVTYRRSEPIVTTKNYLSFDINGTVLSCKIFLPNKMETPPFVFNDEVDEIDGRKFTRKQVSYKDEKCEFMCTAYFAEAIRLLWHCDIRTAGTMRVEYMVRPEIDWNTDNHLCDVKLEFQGDTVMQTNGTASAYGDSSDSSHQSYDSSFDASFN